MKIAKSRNPETSGVITLPPPVGGWNRRDPLANMEITDAVQMDNIIPGVGAVGLRRGVEVHASGLGTGGLAYVESLMVWTGPAGEKFFAARPNAVFEITTAGAVGSAEFSSTVNARWQHTMFGTAAGNFLVIANGGTDVRNYDGSSWSTPSITGVTSANLIGVTSHQSRLWFVEKDKLDPWYLSVSSIAGAATKLLISPYCRLGGYLMAMGSWTRDGGSGADDVLVCVTSKGEVILFSGTDPADADAWSLIGRFKIPPPIGRRCMVNAGSDLGILTATGIIPLSGVLAASESAQAESAITDKIAGAFREAFYTAGTQFGWQVVEYPREQLVVVNVPYAERSIQYQYVLNINSGVAGGAWTRFKNLNANCWCVYNDKLYFGGNDGKVYRYGAGYRDPGDVTISATLQQAFTNCGVPEVKRFVGARPLVRSPNDYSPTVQLKTDYDTSLPSLPSTAAADTPSLWDEAVWDVSFWDASSVPRGTWQMVSGTGTTVSVAMTVSLAQEFTLNQTDLMFERGGFF
jgi:hypothetical protein